MIDSASRNIYYERDSTSLTYLLQEKSERLTENILMGIETSTIWERIQVACDSSKPTEIARKLGYQKQAVYGWRDGERPGLDTLIRISKSTSHSLHWLVTGEGSRKILTENTAQTEPVVSKAERFLKENSLPDVFIKLLERLESVETQLAELKSKYNDPPRDVTRQKNGSTNSPLAITPPKPMSNISHTNDFTVLIDRIQNENPDIDELTISDVCDGETEGVDKDWLEIIQRHLQYYTPLERFGDNDADESAHKKRKAD